MAAFCFSPCKVTYHYEKRRVFAKKCGSFFREMVYYFFIIYCRVSALPEPIL